MLRLFVITIIFSQCVLAEDLIFDDFFKDQRQVYSRKNQVEDFRLALSKLKKINNTWIVDREEILSGDLYRRTFEIDSNYLLRDVHAYIEQYFNQLSARELFQCAGLDCGSSNAWANNYFFVKQLYGLDPSQVYRAWSVEFDDKLVFASTYAVQRGNKRIYVHLDALVTQSEGATRYVPSDPESVLYALQGLRYFRVPDLENKQGSAQNRFLLQPIADALLAKPSLKVAVVGHNFTGVTRQERKNISLQSAQQVADVLQELGVGAQRIHVEGLGGLVPQLGIKSSTVFLVSE